MSYPTKYTRQYDFASYQNANPSRPLPADRVNSDLNAVQNSIGEVVEFLKGFSRADGALANKSVGRDQLADNVSLGFDPPAPWVSGTTYATTSTVLHGYVFYKANVDHTSGDSFDPSKWTVIADFSAGVSAAAASADAAATSAALTAADRIATAADAVSTDADAAAAIAAKEAAEAAAASISIPAFADEAQANAGSALDLIISPKRMADYVAANAPTPTIASQAEAEAGILNTTFMTPLRTRQAIVATTHVVFLESYGGGVSRTAAENDAALDAAYAYAVSLGESTTVWLPSPGWYHFAQPHVFSIKGFYIRGGGMQTTGLKWEPTASGNFLEWFDPPGPLPLYGGGISDCYVFSLENTLFKVAVYTWDVSNFHMERVIIGENGFFGRGFEMWTGANSIGFWPHGRDFGTIRDVMIRADRPVLIGMNPHWNGSQDVWHWHNLYLASTGTTAWPIIQVQAGVIFTNTQFTGFQSWVGGNYGFHYDDSGAFTSATVSNGGSGHVVGDVLTIAGGTTSAPAKVRVLTVGAGGVITAAAVADPGSYTVEPTMPASQSSSTGAGTGATFTLTRDFAYSLAFKGVRKEQSSDATVYTFYINPKTVLYGLSIEDSLFDSGQNGLFCTKTENITLRNTQMIYNLGKVFANVVSANGNKYLKIDNCNPGPNNTLVTTGMTQQYAYTKSGFSAPSEALYL